MPKKAFSGIALAFEDAPAVVLVSGPLDFFVEEAASKVAEGLAKGGAERIRFDDDASPESISDALLNRSLFSPRRVVELDVSRLLGTEAPGALLDAAVEAWEKESPAGRREAFRKARALLSALHLERGADPAATADQVSRKVKRAQSAPLLAELLRELPEQKGAPDLFVPALRTVLERGNDGVVALLTATAPPKDAALFGEIAQKGLVLEVNVGKKESPEALARYAGARAREREVALEADAIARLRFQTDDRPELFAAELSKLLEWAGKGGRVRADDVRANVEDEASESLYLLYDAIGRRDAGEALARLERLFSGRTVRMGKEEIDTDEYWPTRFLGFLTGELRRMLLIRFLLNDPAAGYDAGMSPAAFEERVLPRLLEARGRSGKPLVQGKPYGIYKLAARSARFRTEELARALARSAELDVGLKTSTPPLEALSAYVGQLVAGD
ncbi:MAG: DNA polymerase III subunit delta [Thermoanaerobaculia bacterium]